MIPAGVDINYYIVAFVDILGFSNMVKSDCENRNKSFRYFEVLKELNETTREIEDCDITQFSDSIIFSLPLSNENYLKMIEILANYQQQLFYHSIICRGAVAYGKHFKEKDFMFSQALIEAYQIELKEAVNPRIVLSENLMEYFRPCIPTPKHILIEKDGLCFVDYFDGIDKTCGYEVLKSFNQMLGQHPLPIKEKYYWLYKYWEFKFGEKLPFSTKEFNNV